MPTTMTCDGNTLVLALATMGGVTETEMILSVLRRPMWPMQVLLQQSSDCCILTVACIDIERPK